MKKKILFVVCLLVGLMFINSGLNKFFNYMPMPKEIPENMMKLMMAFMTIGWLMPYLAIAEIIGGILFITNKYRALGAIILFPIVIGVLLVHITAAPAGLPIAVILFAVDIWVIIENREKYLPMINEGGNKTPAETKS